MFSSLIKALSIAVLCCAVGVVSVAMN